MIAAFLCFSIVVLATLWIFQIVLLDDIYRAVKRKDLSRCADTVCRMVETLPDADTIDEVTADMAREYAVCITVYEITEGRFGKRMVETLAEKHVNSFCYLHNIRSDQQLNQLYRDAAEQGGYAVTEFRMKSLFGEDSVEEDGGNVILARILHTGERELFLLFDSEFVPLRATVDTLRSQLSWISFVIVILGVGMAIVFSSRISRPIRRMSSEASKLALGDYNVNFEGGNCQETENLSATLNRAAYELSQLDRMQKDLIANVSHDLRTPLTMIAGYTEVMRDLPGEMTPENMQIVIDETNRLTSLVNDMLEISRYQGGTQTLRITRFNFTEVVRRTLERYAKLREHDGYRIDFLHDRDVYVEADEGRILQVLYNLINNAVNYTGDDKTVVIRQICPPGEGTVVLEVIDTGIGIPQEELPLVWERYYKVNDFHKRANMGTGLGLSIVKNILLLHGAGFGVRSKVGEGSCFWFCLRLSENFAESV